MRVLLISGALPPMKCGVGDYTALLAEALARRRDTVVAIITDVAVGLDGTGKANFEVFPIINGWTISDIAGIIRKIRDWKPDVVHMQFASVGYRRKIFPWLLPALLTLVGSPPVVQTWHEYSGDLIRILQNLPNSLISGGLVVVKLDYKDMMRPWYRWLIRHKLFRYIPNASAIPRTDLSSEDRSLIQDRFAPSSKFMVAFFGFANSRKGAELLFEVVDPENTSLVLICELDPADPYHKSLLDQISSERWAGRVTVTGFLSPDEAGRVLAAADAVMLPFRDGGGVWSTSLQAAMIQGTFVLTTSRDRQGYDPMENVYYAYPGAVSDMRRALYTYMGARKAEVDVERYRDWDSIAGAHVQLYSDVLVGRVDSSPRSDE